jgi:hypothetical protein
LRESITWVSSICSFEHHHAPPCVFALCVARQVTGGLAREARITVSSSGVDTGEPVAQGDDGLFIHASFPPVWPKPALLGTACRPLAAVSAGDLNCRWRGHAGSCARAGDGVDGPQTLALMPQ